MARPRYIGIVVSWAGFLAAFTCAGLTLLYGIAFASSGSRVDVRLLVGGFLLTLGGQRLFRLGRRLSQETTSDRMAQDSRPVILLLRAFGSDGEVADPNWLRQRSMVG